MSGTVEFVVVTQVGPLTVWLIELVGSVKVSVRTLGFGDQGDPVVDFLIQPSELVFAKDVACGLEHFVDVGVVEDVANVAAGLAGGGSLEVLLVFLCNELVELFAHRDCAEGLLPRRPKAVVDVNVFPTNRLNLTEYAYGNGADQNAC